MILYCLIDFTNFKELSIFMPDPMNMEITDMVM